MRHMGKIPPKKPKPKEIETEPGVWERFEHAVDAAAKSGPKHRSKIVPPKRRESKKEAEARRNEPPLRIKSEHE